MNEEEAKIRYVTIEWTDGVQEQILIPTFVSSITIDMTMKRKYGVYGK